MCLIVSAPKGSMIPKELLVDATHKNSDGWGVMYFDGNQIVTEKSPKPDADAIYELTKDNPYETIVHLRMTTHGGNTMANTHPFEVTPQRLYMMHNGIVNIDGTCSKRSDTRVMVEDIIQPLVRNKPGRIRDTGVANVIQHMIGRSSNRLVFLDDTGRLTYFNKNLGLEWKGLWCSNTYAWSLHSEGKRKASSHWGYADRWNQYRGFMSAPTYARQPDGSWAKDTSTKHIGTDDSGALFKGIYDDEFDWADKNVQAADDIGIGVDPNDLVETDFGFQIPRWCAEIVDMEYEDLIEEPAHTLAAVIEELRLNTIGRTA